MSHNYYLYSDADTGQLTWISWVQNMAMSAGMGSPGGREPGGRRVSLDMAAIKDGWSLIRLLLDDPVYYARHLRYLAETLEGPLNADHMAQVYQKMSELIAPHAGAKINADIYVSAVGQLIEYGYQLADSVELFLPSADREADQKVGERVTTEQKGKAGTICGTVNATMS